MSQLNQAQVRFLKWLATVASSLLGGWALMMIADSRIAGIETAADVANLFMAEYGRRIAVYGLDVVDCDLDLRTQTRGCDPRAQKFFTFTDSFPHSVLDIGYRQSACRCIPHLDSDAYCPGTLT